MQANVRIIRFLKVSSLYPQKHVALGIPITLELTNLLQRFKHSKRINVKAQKQQEGGINYFGFKYFPRFPDQKDPPCEPTKLFMVRRISSLRGAPWWEKDLMKQIGLEFIKDTVIMKNTPANNQRLYKLKHLIEITPITTPYGMPDDPKNGYLKENGEFVAYNILEEHNLQLNEAKEENNKLLQKSLDGATLKNRLRLKWYSRYD